MNNRESNSSNSKLFAEIFVEELKIRTSERGIGPLVECSPETQKKLQKTAFAVSRNGFFANNKTFISNPVLAPLPAVVHAQAKDTPLYPIQDPQLNTDKNTQFDQVQLKRKSATYVTDEQKHNNQVNLLRAETSSSDSSVVDYGGLRPDLYENIMARLSISR